MAVVNDNVVDSVTVILGDFEVVDSLGFSGRGVLSDLPPSVLPLTEEASGSVREINNIVIGLIDSASFDDGAVRSFLVTNLGDDPISSRSNHCDRICQPF